ncbi:hypothetical protein ACI3ET_13455 [Ornithinimicrobium sp. LYQ121]|uniref:hypothetical protein n=1 Tax=Ornithinimicrobium sp. LYQ121 TaxID=3378801 RepID=UPI003853E77E
MKMLASALALVLVGLLGGWLWYDATSVARADTDGVVITGTITPAEAQSLVEGGTAPPTVDLVPAGPQTGTADPGAAGDANERSSGPSTAALPSRGAGVGGDVVLVDRFFEALGLSARELSGRAGDLRAERVAAEEAESQAEAERLEAERLEAERLAAEPVAPQPVQPAPVAPGDSCEWDDDEWECDGGDDGDDDDGDDG